MSSRRATPASEVRRRSRALFCDQPPLHGKEELDLLPCQFPVGRGREGLPARLIEETECPLPDPLANTFPDGLATHPSAASRGEGADQQQNDHAPPS